VALPADVDADKAKAKFADGVLELTLPKREAAQRKRIPVE
jgi:HSP20 family protein